MSRKSNFNPGHINASAEDLEGNHGIGRYVFLPGSDGRAQEIAKNFDNCSVKTHPRGHHLYLGTLPSDNGKIAVAAISSGMGCPSAEIILHELFHLGAKRFLRVGTAGSLQPELIKAGALINVQAAVRDESTTLRYAPSEFPAVAAMEFALAILIAAKKLGQEKNLFTGVAHCKSALYAREFGAGPLSKENSAYLKQLTYLGVLASEMESSTLFLQSQIYNHQLILKGDSPTKRVFAGSILAVVSTGDHYAGVQHIAHTLQHSISLAIETVKILGAQEITLI
jgi:uridine phosphorylase